MDVAKILEELRRERDIVEEAILNLQRLAGGQGKRRGRPPAWLAEAKVTPAVGKKRKSAGQKPSSAAA